MTQSVNAASQVSKTALITGITGQDCSYLARPLLEKGYVVHGIKRRASSFNTTRIDPRYFRPAEVDTLLGDPTKAHQKLGWTPTTTLEELVAEMVAADRQEAAKEATLRREGFPVVGSRE